MRINDPAVVAEVQEAFAAYEAALVADDLDALDHWFHDGEEVVRFAFGEVQLGAREVARARRAVPHQTAPRVVEALHVRAWGTDVASAFAVCRLEASGRRVHQSQTWARLDGRWRIVAAHVHEVSTA